MLVVEAVENDIESLENDDEAIGNDVGLEMLEIRSKMLETSTWSLRVLRAVGAVVVSYEGVEGLEITLGCIADRRETVGSSHFARKTHSLSSTMSVCVRSLSESFGIILAVEAVENDVESRGNDVKGTGNKLGVFCIEIRSKT